LTVDTHYAHSAPSPDAAPSVGALCRLPGLTFYASWANLGPTPYAPVAPDQDKPDEVLYLYRCSAARH
jgi:hypothetical protein